MKILIAGASGFLGSTLALHFRRAGHEVGLLIREKSVLTRLQGQENEFIVGRFSSEEDLASFVQAFSPHIIINTVCAYSRQGASALQIMDANLRFGLILLQAAAGLAHPTAFFQAGTALQPGVNLYALSKHQFAAWGRELCSRPDCSAHFVHLKIQQMYGPLDDESKFPAQVMRACLGNAPELKLTAGAQLRDFIYLDDVVAAFDTLANNWEKLEKTSELEVGSGHAVSIRNFVEKIHQLTHSKTLLLFGALPYRPNEAMHCEADNTEMQKLGWAPRFDLESGLRACLNVYSKQIQAISGISADKQ
jgi:nucleoside-diphosphate-sugar epimerase